MMGALNGCVGVPVTDPTTLPAGEWRLDPRHTSVTWGVRHFGLAWTTGRFDEVSASLTLDPEHPETAQMTAIIYAASLSSGDDQLDGILTGTAWLAADSSPQIVYQVTHVEVTGENTGVLSGDLTLRGVTQPTDTNVTFYGGNYNFLEGYEALGFSGDMLIDRRDFGVGNLPGTIAGANVRIHIEAEFLKD